MHTLIHTKSDTRPSYTFRLRKGQKALNISGSTVVLLFRKSDNTTVVSKTCTIAGDGSTGVCVMSFSATDVNLIGYSQAEIKVTFSDTGVQHALYRLTWYIRDEYEEPPL